MNWGNYGTDHEEAAQLDPSTENQITLENRAIAAKRKRERAAFGFTVLLTTAVVTGIVLHSSGGNEIAQSTLAQTTARVNSFRNANFGIEEGKTIKCSEDDPALYRMTNNERHPYPSTEIAAAWDPNWQDYVIADCTDIPIGEDMSIPSDATESSTSTDEGYSPTDPTETPADEFTSADTTEPDAAEPDTTEPDTTDPDTTKPDATEPDATEPDAMEPDATEPDATELETTEPDVTEPDAAAPDATKPEATEPNAFKPGHPDATEPETSESVNPDATEPDTAEPVHDEYDGPGNTVKSGEPEPSGPEGGVPGMPDPEIDTPQSWWKAPSDEEPKPSNSRPSNAELKEPGQGAFHPIKPEEHEPPQMQQGPPGNPNNQRENSNQLRGGRNW